ncbi:glycosyltransferase [Gracilimonas mengyeensis]|uniref:Glycosyl transferase family 2 n=1 Tax=Gracilimonas mengyeensis TaxID=1302730 RepID=A0A521FKQ4_9BACT|nr:glycosyltransferase family A protein [Gracilimonas mengyeensis]SMO96716.1 Glycosyl transferase family 2 [Gracilimonas mengyeensis]
MISFFYKQFNKTFDPVSGKKHNDNYNKIKRLFYKYLLNLIAPIFFKLKENNKVNNKFKEKYGEIDFIVSLTSFPLRIDKLWIVIESILNQNIPPSQIYLWLAKDQFPTDESIPDRLKKLTDRGLRIRMCDEDLKSHKKYYYAMQEFPNKVIITLDDDIIYSPDTLQFLLDKYLENPDCVCANRCCIIDKNASYNDWETINSKPLKSNKLLPTGCGGVLYPPNSLYKDVLKKEIFIETCFYGDDLWLNSMAYLNGTNVLYTGYDKRLISILYRENYDLHSLNVGENSRNDKQISAIRMYYKKKLGVDPFDRE